ncbi:hypothetical protein QQX98_009508 [Neonectria punicea]|uniref:Zn(2)-C6 fungal-type domain-containing protein n=1 Tax=Neonectria punicea TaxID=979145 RepID=A0ABR1GS95_9HYPO
MFSLLPHNRSGVVITDGPHPAEEKPVCKACARFRLPCQYELRLKWHTKDADKTVSNNHAAVRFLHHPGTPRYFVNFSGQDFEPTATGRYLDMGTDSEATRNRGWNPPSEMRAASPISASSSPSSSYILVDEPSWFSPLDFSSPLDEMLFMYYYDELIVLAIMLCVFEIKDGSGPDWAKHLYGGRSILQSKVQKRGSQMWAGGLSWWANKFFGYLAVNSANGNELESLATMETPEFWLSQGFEVDDIDGFMGCSSKTMAITAAICNLARARNNDRIDTSDLDVRGNDLECRIFDLKQRSTQLFVTLQETSNLKDIVAMFLEDRYVMPRAKVVALTAEARRQAAFILLYICVKAIPVHRLEVRARVMDCLLCITAVAQLMVADDSPVWGMTPLVWPLFVAGASALRDEDRFQVVENVARAAAMVKAIWKQYDMETNVRHAELWKLYVDPNSEWPLSLA